jgi:hypothetical protein
VEVQVVVLTVVGEKLCNSRSDGRRLRKGTAGDWKARESMENTILGPRSTIPCGENRCPGALRCLPLKATLTFLRKLPVRGPGKSCLRSKTGAEAATLAKSRQ